MKWFARGRLWESMEQEHEDFQQIKVQEKEIATGGRVAITRTRERDSTRRSGAATSASSVPTATPAHPRTRRRSGDRPAGQRPSGKPAGSPVATKARRRSAVGAIGRRGAMAAPTVVG